MARTPRPRPSAIGPANAPFAETGRRRRAAARRAGRPADGRGRRRPRHDAGQPRFAWWRLISPCAERRRGRRGWGCRRFRRARRRRSATRVPFARVRDGRWRGVAQSGSAAGWPRCGLCSASAGVPVFDRVRESAGAVSRARVPARARRDLRARPFCPSSFSWRLPVPPDRPWPRWQKLRAALFQ